MSKRPVIEFYVLAFGIAWLGWVPAALGSRSVAPFDAPYFQLLLIHLALQQRGGESVAGDAVPRRLERPGVVVTGVSVTALAIAYALVALILIALFGGVNLSRRERVVPYS